MDYFKFFPRTLYVYGNEAEDIGTGDVLTQYVQDISSYVEVIDQVKRNSAFHLKYYIQENERPDQVSYNLYGSTNYHWTFFMMNDKLREQGWPLSNIELEKRLHKDFPNLALTTDIDLTGHFLPGQIVVGTTTDGRGRVLRRNLDLGQIIVEPIPNLKDPNDKLKANFSEFVTSKSVNAITTQTAFCDIVEEYNSVRHYKNTAGRIIDIDPSQSRSLSALFIPVTQAEFYNSENDNLKEINIIKPELIGEITASFKQALRA